MFYSLGKQGFTVSLVGFLVLYKEFVSLQIEETPSNTITNEYSGFRETESRMWKMHKMSSCNEISNRLGQNIQDGAIGQGMHLSFS